VAKDTEGTRAGGREPAEPATSGFSGGGFAAARRSSGAASTAANLLDLRQKVNYIFEVLCALDMIDPEVRAEIEAYRQRGFRRGR